MHGIAPQQERIRHNWNCVSPHWLSLTWLYQSNVRLCRWGWVVSCHVVSKKLFHFCVTNVKGSWLSTAATVWTPVCADLETTNLMLSTSTFFCHYKGQCIRKHLVYFTKPQDLNPGWTFTDMTPVWHCFCNIITLSFAMIKQTDTKIGLSVIQNHLRYKNFSLLLHFKSSWLLTISAKTLQGYSGMRWVVTPVGLMSLFMNTVVLLWSQHLWIRPLKPAGCHPCTPRGQS